MVSLRDRTLDGFSPRLRSFLLQRFPSLWGLAARQPHLAAFINSKIIGIAVGATRNRPHPHSTLCDYTSWAGLTERGYYARHLRASDSVPETPSLDELQDLFRRPGGRETICPKSSLLFPVFAQYLTDGFLRTDMDDRFRTTSNHEIDLSPLYGRTRAQTRVLRTMSQDRDLRGRLKWQEIDGEAYPPFLFEEDGRTIRAQFLGPGGEPVLDKPLGFKDGDGNTLNGYERQIFAVGGDRVNATPQVSMLNTLFLREHNRIAAEFVVREPHWDDDRVFETARAMVIVIFIKIVIEEYINHISSTIFKLKADPRPVWRAAWNRPNWMTLEFSLLYRWHSMIPNTIRWNGEDVPAPQMLRDNRPLTARGLAGAFADTCRQHACRLGLFNTADFLIPVERASIDQGRYTKLRSYNDYREAFGMNRLTSFQQMTGDPARIAALERCYGTPDKVEYFVGLFAEDVNPNTPMPPLIGAMVAVDAFSQALTNPLLSEHVYNTDTFTDLGYAELEKPQSIAALLARQNGGSLPDGLKESDLTMTRADWKRETAPF